MDNPQAFPTQVIFNEKGEQTAVLAGMTLRDYFAGQALVGFLSASVGVHKGGDISKTVYLMADAMLKERSK